MFLTNSSQTSSMLCIDIIAHKVCRGRRPAIRSVVKLHVCWQPQGSALSAVAKTSGEIAHEQHQHQQHTSLSSIRSSSNTATTATQQQQQQQHHQHQQEVQQQEEVLSDC